MKLFAIAGFTFLLVFGGVARADVVELDSMAGLPTSIQGTDTVTITPHPLWEPNHPQNPGDASDYSAVWISDMQSGYGDSQFQPYEGQTPVVDVFDNFSSGAGLLHLDVWADDTADVILDGDYLAHAVFTQSICSGQPVGCRPEDDARLSAYVSAGNHTLEFVLYQVGTGTDSTSNPFGLLFAGEAPSPVPEPNTVLPIGVLLIGLALALRKKAR